MMVRSRVMVMGECCHVWGAHASAYSLHGPHDMIASYRLQPIG